MTFEKDRHDGRVRLGHHPGGKAAPAGIHRLGKGFGRRADGPARKNPDRAAIGQIVQRHLAGLDIQLHRLFRLVEGNRQDDAVQIFCLAEHLVRQNAKIAPHGRQDMAHHQTVENAVGVVRDQDERAVLGDVVERPACHVQR